MSGCGLEVRNSKMFEEIFCGANAEYFPLICDKVHWNAAAADPVVEDGIGNGGSFLVGEGYQLDVFGNLRTS